MRRQLLSATIVMAMLTLLTGIVYPLVVTGIGRVALRDQAEGSLVRADGRIVGSRLIGQAFTTPRYFHPRPSAAGDGYDAEASGASNLGPTNDTLIDAVRERAERYRRENGLPPGAPVPVDAVTASGSGLDPHISPENARLQIPRVARARGMDPSAVRAEVERATSGRVLGVLGEPAVNVLELNMALDSAPTGR